MKHAVCIIIIVLGSLLASASQAVPVVRGGTAAFWQDRAVLIATVTALSDHPDGQRQVIKLRIDRVVATHPPVDTTLVLYNPVYDGPYFAQVEVDKQYLFCPRQIDGQWMIESKFFSFLDGKCVVGTSGLSDEARSELEQRVIAVRNEAMASGRKD